MCSVAANARQVALQIDASAGGSYVHACGPGCHCLNCHNMPTHQEADEELRQMEVDDQREHQATEEYV